MWLIYINENYESYTGFTKLKDDIIKLKNIGETEYYITFYIQIAKKFEEIIKKIIQIFNINCSILILLIVKQLIS